MTGRRTVSCVAMSWAFCACALLCAAQEPAQEPASQQPPAEPASQPPTAQPTNNTTAPIRLTLQDALDRARKNSVPFNAAVTNAGLARQDRRQAFNALLPSVTYDNSAIYTQSAGPIATAATGVPVIFIANNAVHEYVSQANVHEAIDVAGIANYRKVSATAAIAKWQAEIASRGLVVVVTQGYYFVAATQRKLETAKRNADEGERFFKVAQDLEAGGEVAHADVIKAELQMRERQRALQEAQLAFLNARLDFSILIFPKFEENFEVAEDLHAPVPLPTLAEVQARAARDNPDVRAALAAVQASNHDVFGARAGYLPALTLDYFYGIDATRFATHTVFQGQKFSNLGSSVVGTLELRRDQTKRELSLAQRRLLAEIRSLYAEAETALNEQEGLSRSAQLAEESLKLVTLRYRNGESTVLEVVDAQNTFAQANGAYQDGAVRYRVALANLQTLTGVLTTP